MNRDEIALRAMAAFIQANPQDTDPPSEMNVFEQIAMASYAMADAMIKERKRGAEA